MSWNISMIISVIALSLWILFTVLDSVRRKKAEKLRQQNQHDKREG